MSPNWPTRACSLVLTAVNRKGFAMKCQRPCVTSLAAIAVCLTCSPRQHSYGADQQPLIDKTLVVWARPANLEQRGSGTLSILEAEV